MKSIATSVVTNIVLFVLSFGLYTVTAFWVGLGSSDKYAMHAWALFYFFVFVHFLAFTLITRKKGTTLRSAYYFSGVLTMLIAYASVIYYYST